jgi:hypothetical protein
LELENILYNSFFKTSLIQLTAYSQSYKVAYITLNNNRDNIEVCDLHFPILYLLSGSPEQDM